MGFEVRRRLSVADTVTLFNAVVGFVAGAIAFTDQHLAARLILLAVIADAIDGIVARNGDSSAVGPLLDSVTDVVSFGATPSLFLYVLLTDAYGGIESAHPAVFVGLALLASAYVVCSIVRTAFYSTYFDSPDERPGMPNTLGSIIIATAYLSGITNPLVLSVGALGLSLAMIAPFDYPKPGPKHAVPMGVVQAVAVVAPAALFRAGPRAMLAIALLFFALGPWFYPGE